MLIEIGDEFVSAPGSIILSHDASTFICTGKYRVEKTVIGNRVFLGANAVILPAIPAVKRLNLLKSLQISKKSLRRKL